MPPAEVVLVRLLRPVMPNNIGEVIGVPRDVADGYLDGAHTEWRARLETALVPPSENNGHRIGVRIIAAPTMRVLGAHGRFWWLRLDSVRKFCWRHRRRAAA